MRWMVAALAALVIAGCDGDEQEADTERTEQSMPGPMPATAPADTVGTADTAGHATTDTARTTRH